jgi:hypothetical protein
MLKNDLRRPTPILIKQDACSGVHTDLKMTAYVLWCSRQEYSGVTEPPEAPRKIFKWGPIFPRKKLASKKFFEP